MLNTNDTDSDGASGERSARESGRLGAPGKGGRSLPRAGEPLWILWNASGTHADVQADRPELDLPSPQAHRLMPGDAFYGIPFEAWAERVNQTVDVLALQARWHATHERERRTLPVSLEIHGDDWQAEPATPAFDLPASEYGFSTGTRAVACSREQLVRQCVDIPETPAVWAPGTGGLAPPETVPFLVEALRLRRRAAAETSAATAGVALLAVGGLAWSLGSGSRSGWIILCAFAASWLAATLYEYRQARGSGGETFEEARQQYRHSVWIESRSSIYTRALLILLACVMMAELFGIRDAVEAAGLVKERVRDGEVWRLLTGILLHGGLLHLALNLLALWSLGPLVEAHARRAALPILFLASALVGSVASLLLLPDAPSVGASGGILGLAGYLFVLGYRRRNTLPGGFVRRIGLGILATGVFGLVGYAFVDNATHLGGLLTGMIFAVLLPSRSAGLTHRFDRPLFILGNVTLTLLALGALGSMVLIYEAIAPS